MTSLALWHRRRQRLHAHLADGLEVASDGQRACSTPGGAAGCVVDAATIDARLVVDATGRPSPDARARDRVAQTAFGIVVPNRRRVRPMAITLMDLRPLPAVGRPTFCYVVPVDGGWLVEETVLAARPPVPPELLPGASRLASAPRPGRRRRRDARRAGRRADGRAGPDRGGPSSALRRRRRLHPSGDRLLGGRIAAGGAPRRRRHRRRAVAVRRPSGGSGTPCGRRRCAGPAGCTTTAWRCSCAWTPTGWPTFFDAFFDLPEDVWAPYLRIDATPAEVSRTMTAVLRRLPWAMRRRLVVNPVALPDGR